METRPLPAQRLSFGGAFADAFGVYGRRFGAVVAAALVFGIPAALLYATASVALMPDDFRGTSGGGEADGGDWARFGGALLVGVLVTVPFSALLIAALYRIRTGGGIGESIRFALDRFVPVTLTALAVALALLGAMFVGMTVAIVVGDSVAGTVGAVLLGIVAGLGLVVLVLWLGAKWFAAVPAAAAERLPPLAAIRRSAALVRGRWWTVFGILIVASLIVGAASGFIGGIIGAIGAAADTDTAYFVTELLSILISSTFATPIIGLFAVAIYEALRAEKDAGAPA